MRAEQICDTRKAEYLSDRGYLKLTLLPNESRNPSKEPSSNLDVNALIERAKKGLADGKPREAVANLRAASALAPMREDLRGMLVAALKMKGGAGSEGPGPTMVRPRAASRPPLLEPARMTPLEKPEIEEIRTEMPERRPKGESSPMSRADRPERARPPSQGEAPRPQTAPIRSRSAFQVETRREGVPLGIFGIVGVVALVLALAGVGWIAYSGKNPFGEKKESKEAAKPAEAMGKQDQALLDQAQDYLRQNLFAQALEKAQLVKDGPEKEQLLAKVYGQQGDAHSRDNKYEDARTDYEEALKHDAKNETLAYDLGWTYYMLGRKKQGGDRQASKDLFDQAERYFKVAEGINPSNPKTLDGLARVEIARGDSPAAGQYYRKIVQNNPESEEAKSARKTMESMGLKL